MRRKLNYDEKRSVIIGVKVTPKVRKQIEYLSGREAESISTYIEKLIKQRIDQFTKDTKTDWDKELASD